MSLHLIKTIARYEMRTLLRSWFFRIFVGLAIVGLGIFNIALNVESSGAPWIYRALAASIPYANLIILNLGQAIVAVFLASEFLKQDKKNDTVEVIYARSMSNGQYILGKTLGILAVFLVLNVLILLMGIGFSFISNASSQNVLAYLGYPLLISLPTLVFILGLSFFMMVLVKNQAITFILLLGYIALTIFYLYKKAFHLFDYIAYNVPMMYSSITGFGDFNEIILHRSIYFFLGIGLIFLTVYKLQRLPQQPQYSSISLYVGLLFILTGVLFSFIYLNAKQNIQKQKAFYVELNNRYSNCNFPTVKSCSIDLKHLGESIAVESRLVIQNAHNQNIDSLIFSLNPSLTLHKLWLNGKETAFSRHNQIVTTKLTSTFQPGDTMEVKMEYAGTVDESICFLDTDPGLYNENFNMEVFTLRKRYAFLQKNYVCLTSESLWYPVAGVGYATSKPMFYQPDFVNFSVKVKTIPGLTAISQGEMVSGKSGEFKFRPEHPLPKISLLIGDYRKYSVKVDSVEYNLYSIKGHDYYKASFSELKDTISYLIRDIKQEYEVNLGLKYPFKRFSLAEVPVHFALDNHIYTYTSDAVQPEMIFYPEKGVLFNNSDFRHRKYRIEREMKRNNEEALADEVQSRMFKQVLRENIMAGADQNYNFRDINPNTYSVFPEFYSFISQLESEKWPVLSVAFEAYVKERYNEKGSNPRWYEGLSKEERINLELNNASLRDLVRKAIKPEKNEDDPVLLRDLVLAKGKHLFNTLRARYGEKELDTLFTSIILSHPFKKITNEELASSFRVKFKTNLDSITDQWYSQKSLPAFRIRDIASYKVVAGEASRYQIRFKIANPAATDGIVTLNIELNNPNRRREGWWDDDFKADFSRKLFLPARSSKEVGYTFTTEPARMSVVTHISQNLPYNLTYNFQGFTETRNIPPLDTIQAILPIGSENAIEIIVDNEDKGFSIRQARDQAVLKSMIKNNSSSRYKYVMLRSWNPHREWKAVLRSEFYGEFIHSSYYTKGGAGDRIAIWKAVLPEKGTYELYYYLDKPNMGWRRSNKWPDYNFVVYHDAGPEKINRSTEDLENGWFLLGTYSFSSDTAKVELSNKTTGDMIFADAVKWVKTK